MEEQDLQDQPVKNYTSDLGTVETKVVTLPGITTQSGYAFKEINISYLTLGELSPQKDNVVFVFHALSGSAHVAGMSSETNRPGWWDFHVGPGKSIDTDRYFVICSNILGGCNGSTGPTSINPDTGKRYGTDFPLITVRDMVNAQVRLLDYLGIDKIFSLVGGSMGGMQALVWCVDHPERVHSCITIATCMAQSPMQIAFSEVGRQAITTDPEWKNGQYKEDERPAHGLAVARMIGHITYLSQYSMRKKFGRKLQENVPEPDSGVTFPTFSVESYLHHQGGNFVKRFDPNTYLYLTKAMNMFDLLDNKPAAEVFRNVSAQFLIVSFESDWLYPPVQSRELVRNLKRANKKVSYVNLETPYGHDSFLIKNPEFQRIIQNFLNQEYDSFHAGVLKETDSEGVAAN